MRDLLDALVTGSVSRREFLERMSVAGAALPLFGLPVGVAPQPSQREKQKETPDAQIENLVYSPANIGGGGRLERNFYRDWIKKSKVPMVEGYSILDASKQEIQPWPEIEGRGIYLNFSGNVHMDAVILEIPEGKALAERTQFYEQLIYVLAGRGYTAFGKDGRQKVEWGEGSLFAVPMNLTHRHFNSNASHPARLLSITTFPFMLQVFGSVDLLHHLNFEFKDRYSGEPDYFAAAKRVRQRWDRTNFVRDIRTAEVVLWEERGKGNASLFWEMAGNTVLEPHISEFPVGTYKLGHRHPYEAIILTLNGKGYTLFGKESLKGSDALKLDWKSGSIVSPPYFWFHQHFNTGERKARYLAITEGDFPKRLGVPLEVEQIEADREDPSIRRRFGQELEAAGAQGHQARE